MFNPRERSQPITSYASLLLACLLLCEIASATTSIILSKKSGPPTSKILVSGRGFEPNVGVDIFFDTKDKALVVTNGKGEFHDAGIYAPRSARPGEHWVTALERNNDKGAQKPFLVQTNWNQFHFDADGTRLNPYENVLNPRTVRSLDLKWSYRGSDNGGYSSPTIVDGVVYVGSGYPDFSIYALNARTGAKLWSYTTGSYVDSSPAVANGVVYVGSDDDNVYALSARTGTPLWSYHTGGSVNSSPVVANGVVYVGSDDFNVYALNASTGVKLWNYNIGSVVYSAPAVADGVVYVDSWYSSIYALNAYTGVELWSYDTSDRVDSSPAVAYGAVYFGGLDFTVHALDAHNGANLWSYSLPGRVDSSPAVANGVVYVGADDNNVYALDASTGVYLWSYPTGGYVASSPSVVDGVVYVGSYDGNVYAFGMKNGSEQAATASKHPDLKTLRPDFNLKVSKPNRNGIFLGLR
jgi:outer membrane protein assembly factor BamB